MIAVCQKAEEFDATSLPKQNLHSKRHLAKIVTCKRTWELSFIPGQRRAICILFIKVVRLSHKQWLQMVQYWRYSAIKIIYNRKKDAAIEREISFKLSNPLFSYWYTSRRRSWIRAQDTDFQICRKNSSNANLLLRIWRAAVSSSNSGSPFQQLFAGVILVHNYFNKT